MGKGMWLRLWLWIWMRERQGWAVVKPALNINGKHFFHKRSCCQADSKRKKVEAKQEFVKVALKQKARWDRLVKKMEKAGEL